MKCSNIVAVLVALAVAVPVSSPIALADEVEISAPEQARLDAALKLGRDIYRYDQAAWHTTDALFEEIRDPAKAGIGGWVIDETDKGLSVIYFRVDGETYRPAFSAVYDGTKVRSRTLHPKDSAPLEPRLVEQAKARSVPIDFRFQRCSQQPFNTVVLPTGKAEGGHYVYFLVPQPEPGTIMIGGNYRFEVRDGKMVDDRTFTKSCLALGGQGMGKGDKLAALNVTHLLDPIPTEIHVFAAYSAGVPMYVITVENELLWSIEIKDGEPQASIVQRMQ